jgi:hypothetical protein
VLQVLLLMINEQYIYTLKDMWILYDCNYSLYWIEWAVSGHIIIIVIIIIIIIINGSTALLLGFSSFFQFLNPVHSW